MSLIEKIHRFNRVRLGDANRGMAFTSRSEVMADLNRSRAALRRLSK